MDIIIQHPFTVAGAVCFLVIPLFYIGLTIRGMWQLRRETIQVASVPADARATTPHPAI